MKGKTEIQRERGKKIKDCARRKTQAKNGRIEDRISKVNGELWKEK